MEWDLLPTDGMRLTFTRTSIAFFTIASFSTILGSCQAPALAQEQYVQVTVVKDSNQNHEKTAVFVKLMHGDAKFIAKTIGMSFYLTLGELNLTADERQNAIVVSGKPENVAAAIELLKALDQPSSLGNSNQEK